MSELRVPIRDLLTEPFDDRELRRIGARIAERRAGPRGLVGVLMQLLPSPAICASFVVGALTAVLLLVGMNLIPRGVNPASAELRLRGGGGLVTLAAPASDQPMLVQFSEGSEVVLLDQAKIEPIENVASRIVLRQTQGQAVYDVRPGGSRRWLIECPPASVEVVGTRFILERSNAQVRVAVERGRVVVRARQIHGGEVSLEAGQSVEVQSDPVSQAYEMPSAMPIARRQLASAPEREGVADLAAGSGSSAPWPISVAAMPASNPDQEPTTEEWVQTSGGASSAASAYPTTSGQVPVRPDVEFLLREADQARRQGRNSEAARYLERILAEYGGDSRVGLAAFYLGKIQLDSGRAAQAIASFEMAIARGLPAGLLEDAHARRVEARVRAGDRPGAMAAATAYIKRFPSGHYREAVERWVR